MYNIMAYTNEKIRKPDATLDKFLPIAKRAYLATKSNAENMQLDMIVNKQKQKEKKIITS